MSPTAKWDESWLKEVHKMDVVEEADDDERGMVKQERRRRFKSGIRVASSL